MGLAHALAGATIVMAGIALGAAAPVSPVREELAAQVGLVSPAALARLADDWEKNGVDGSNGAIAELRTFASEAAARKKAALAALEANDIAPARRLLADQRRLMARHPLVKGLEILAVKHTDGGVVHTLDPNYEPGRGANVYKRSKGLPARYEPHPALPALSCYNNLDVEKNQPSSLVVFSGFDGDVVSERELYRPSSPATIHSVDLEFDAKRILFVAPDPAGGFRWCLWWATPIPGSPRCLIP